MAEAKAQVKEFDGVCDDNQIVCQEKQAKSVESGDFDKEQEQELPPINIWTRKTFGLPLTGFICGYMVGILVSTKYGFFLGYLGLQPYVLAAVTSFSRIPEVLLLPFGILGDACPIRGMHRKPYLLIAWTMVGLSTCMVALRPLPKPYYCIGADGEYDYDQPPCNPAAHGAKTWYVAAATLASTGLALAQVSGEGLLLTYSQREPYHMRGKIKAEMSMMLTAGNLAANLTVAFFMNSKEYLGTFDWCLGYNGIHVIAMILIALLIIFTIFFVEEPQRRRSVPHLQRSQSIKLNFQDSWRMVKQGAFMGILIFGFCSQMMVNVQTTASPLVRSRWAGVKVLPQQLCQMLGHFTELLAVWMVKKYLLQCSWRKMFFATCVISIVLDAIPAFSTIFNLVRNQYFYLGEEVLAQMPAAAVKLVSGLVLIEMAEPGKEGLCFGLLGGVFNAAAPVGTALSNQIFSLFRPSLSDAQNYEDDTYNFRKTVAMSYVLTYGTTLMAFVLVWLIPDQKESAKRRKQTWSSRVSYGVLVLALLGIGVLYSLVLLLLTNLEATSCMEFLGGEGC